MHPGSILACVAAVVCAEDTYIVRYKKNISDAEKAEAKALVQTNMGREFDAVNGEICEYSVIDGFSSRFSRDVADLLAQHSSIETVEKDFIIDIEIPPQELDFEELPATAHGRRRRSTYNKLKTTTTNVFQYKGAGILWCADTSYSPLLRYYVEDTKLYPPSYENCIDACQRILDHIGRQGFRFAAASNKHCFCGNEFLHGVTSNQCDAPCIGNPLQKCGNDNSVLIFGPIDSVDGPNSIPARQVEEHLTEGWGALHVLGRSKSDMPHDTIPVCKRPYTKVYVYVLDTGVNANHTQLAGRVEGVKSFDEDDDGADLNGHGTHIASNIVGKTIGLAKWAKVVPVKIVGKDGKVRVSTLLKAFEWVLQDFLQHDKPSVVNISFGSKGVRKPINEATKKLSVYMPIIAAAGNNRSDACCWNPQSATEVITVGATGMYMDRVLRPDQIAQYSNYGPCVNIFAPGSFQAGAGLNKNDILHQSGTSIAAPIVASVAALLLEQRPNATSTQVRERLLQLSKPSVKGKLHSAPNRLLQINPENICDLWN